MKKYAQDFHKGKVRHRNKDIGRLNNRVHYLKTVSYTHLDVYKRQLRRHRDLARYYTRKNISISLLRAARKRDMEGVLSLYGTDEQRYW